MTDHKSQKHHEHDEAEEAEQHKTHPHDKKHDSTWTTADLPPTGSDDGGDKPPGK